MKFDTVFVVVSDANPHLAKAMRTSFGDQGLTNVVPCSTSAALEEAIGDKLVDLLVLDHGLPGINFVDLVQRIRHRKLGHNPFVTVIATLGKAEPASMRAMMNAGVDDIASKPLTAERLLQRVNGLAQKREPFVISSGYVGPNRRTAEREGDDRSKIRDVPNTLRARMIDGAGNAEVERMISRAAAQFSEGHFEAAISEIDRIISRVIAFYRGGGDAEEWRRDLQRLILTAEAWRDAYDGPSSEAVAKLAGMLIVLARRIGDAPAAQKVVEVDLLGQLAQAVRGAIEIGRRDARHFDEIARIINRFVDEK
jgi:DNA-binding response OmpR family regulator